MKKIAKIVALFLTITILVLTCAGCQEASRVSYNVSKEADNFNIYREIIVINVRDETVLYTLTGFFSLQDEGHNELVVVSEIGPGKYKKDFIYLNEYTTYVCTDLTGAEVDPYHYELNILPKMLPGFSFTFND